MSDIKLCQSCHCRNYQTIRLYRGEMAYLCDICSAKIDKRLSDHSAEMEVRLLEYIWSLGTSPVNR